MLDNTTDNSVHRLSSQDEHPSSVISKKVHDTRSNGSNSRKARKVSHGLARDNEERQVCIRHHDEIIRRTDTKQTVGNEPFVTLAVLDSKVQTCTVAFSCRDKTCLAIFCFWPVSTRGKPSRSHLSALCACLTIGMQTLFWSIRRASTCTEP